jgi:hypothetical protein
MRTMNLRYIAEQCVTLVADQFDRRLDWTLDSLEVLDEVCAALEPLAGERLELWWKLVGAYTGEVLIGAYGGEWGSHPDTTAPVVLVQGCTAQPFTIAHRVLTGEPFKSLASFGRVFPAIIAQSQRP